MITAPVFYSPDVETLKPVEQQVRDGLNATFDTILERTAEGNGHAVRSVRHSPDFRKRFNKCPIHEAGAV